jgi:uncharacterized surface protein with fasciclin (FAS1) repeats
MKIKNQIIKLMLGAVVAFTNFSCSEGDNDKTIEKLPNIVEIAKADPQFSVLVRALQVTSLETVLSSQGSYTVFAPTNTAFAAQGITLASLNALVPSVPADATTIATIKRILQNHVLAVGTKSNDLLNVGYTKTFAAGIGTSNMSMFVGLATNGDVLVNGGSTNNGAKVIKADVDASNGIIHVVDNVILLPTLVNHVVANPAFSTLKDIVTSGVGGTYGNQTAVFAVLTGATATAPKTVFAPLNSAFASALGTGFLTPTYTAVPGNITKVLQYHVSASNSNLTATSATTWNALTVPFVFNTLAPVAQTFSIAVGTVKITSAATGSLVSNIKVVNVQAVNGVIHAVDTVLQPN